MNEQTQSNTMSSPEQAPEPSGDRKPYQEPELKRWGTVSDITKGGLNGTEDLPGEGGTGGA